MINYRTNMAKYLFSGISYILQINKMVRNYISCSIVIQMFPVELLVWMGLFKKVCLVLHAFWTSQKVFGLLLKSYYKIMELRLTNS